MAINTETIDHTTLENLVQAGAIRGADVIGHSGGWGIVVKFGMTERALAARRGSIRSFRKFETLVSYLKSVGISQYNVNAADFDSGTLKLTRKRPDSSERMRTALEAQSHIDWMKKKVAESLSDPAPNVTHAQVRATAMAIIESKKSKYADKVRA